MERGGKAAGPLGKESARPGKPKERRGKQKERQGKPDSFTILAFPTTYTRLGEIPSRPSSASTGGVPANPPTPPRAAHISFSPVPAGLGRPAPATADSPSATPIEQNMNSSTGSAEGEGKSRPAGLKRLETAMGGPRKKLAWIRARRRQKHQFDIFNSCWPLVGAPWLIITSTNSR